MQKCTLHCCSVVWMNPLEILHIQLRKMNEQTNCITWTHYSSLGQQNKRTLWYHDPDSVASLDVVCFTDNKLSPVTSNSIRQRKQATDRCETTRRPVLRCTERVIFIPASPAWQVPHQGVNEWVCTRTQ